MPRDSSTRAFTIDCYYPALGPLPKDARKLKRTVRLLQEIEASSRAEVLDALEDYGSPAIATTVYALQSADFRGIDSITQKRLAESNWHPRFRDTFLIHTHASVEVTKPVPIYSAANDSEDSTTEREATPYEIREIASHEFEKGCYDLVMASNLALPGSLETGAGVLFVNGKFARSTKTLISDFYHDIEECKRRGWPTFVELKLDAVIAWILSHHYHRSMGLTPVGRAYNSYTYSFSEPGRSDYMRLFWALMGVESLYGSGTGSIMHQVSERSQVLLGERRSFKKEFKEMYSVRSSFVHGSAPFPSRHFPYDALPEYEDFAKKVWNATTLAESMLVASLQELIRRDWHTLVFRTEVAEK